MTSDPRGSRGGSGEDQTPEIERTLIDPSATGGDAGPLRLVWTDGGDRHEKVLQSEATIGRDPDSDVRLTHASISRAHARLYPSEGRWHVQDLESANGTFLDELSIKHAVIPRSATLQVGSETRLRLEAANAPADRIDESIARRVFGPDESGEVGSRTQVLRAAYRQVDRRQKVRYRGIIAAIVVVLMGSFAFAYQQYRALGRTRELATEIFYSMKAVELQVARIEERVRESGDPVLLGEIEARRKEVRELEAQYDRFLEELDVLGTDLSEEDRLILRVARMFGECELTMPEEFVEEVKRYIHEWRLSPRLRTSVQRMNELGLTNLVVDAMLEQHLPPQFLYVALQESSFDNEAIGPKTRFGIAKGIWQFIPSTARRYGLRTGPLVEMPVFDPNDDRHKPPLATRAAAQYLRDIYSRDAQASSLLVMASYNWGPTHIRRRIREMPANPRDRNFWELLKLGDIPRETYNYVLYIVSAAVIGEDPELFGFDFENPLAGLGESLAGGTEFPRSRR